VSQSIRVEADLVDQLFNSSEKRLARLLLLLANFGKEAEPEPVIAKISQKTLRLPGAGGGEGSRSSSRFRHEAASRRTIFRMRVGESLFSFEHSI
jgi:hypothetical protein